MYAKGERGNAETEMRVCEGGMHVARLWKNMQGKEAASIDS